MTGQSGSEMEAGSLQGYIQFRVSLLVAGRK